MMRLNIGWLLPDGTDDCGSWSYFWLDVVLALLFIVELTVLYCVFYAIIISIDVFYVQERYGFRKMTWTKFLIVRLIVSPIAMALRVFLLTLITMAIFHYLSQLMPIYAFIILVVILTSIIVVSDILLHTQLGSLSKGKTTLLKDTNE